MIGTLITIILSGIVSSVVSIFVVNWMLDNPGVANKIMDGIIKRVKSFRKKDK